MRRLAALAIVAVLAAACGGAEEAEIRTERLSFVDLPAPSGWVTASYSDLAEANFNLFPYPTQSEIAIGLFSRGATAGWSTISASLEGSVDGWILASSFDRPADELILPAFTADLRDDISWSGEKPKIEKVTDLAYTVEGETADGYRYLRTFMNEAEIVVVVAGTSLAGIESFESVLALISVATAEE